MLEQLDYSTLEIREIQVTGIDKKVYVLREADGKTVTEHRNAIMSSTQFGPDGKVVGIKSLASVEAKFVASCMWNEQNNHPTTALIQSWPGRVQKELYEKAKELSDIGEVFPAFEALKAALSRNDSPVTLENFSEWVSSLEDKECQPLVKLFKEESDLKNS
jgi:hypothetical protein